jgi:hypothetical protein
MATEIHPLRPRGLMMAVRRPAKNARGNPVARLGGP